MTALRNSVQLIGHLGKKPVTKKFTNGKSLTTLSLATTEHYLLSNGEKAQDTQWHQVVIWGKQGQDCTITLDKGMEVEVKGKIQYRQYEDKTGIKRYITEIIAENVAPVLKN